jgi:hypothetical protein
MVREGFNKSATFVNTPLPLEMLNRWKLLWIVSKTPYRLDSHSCWS